MQKFDIFIYMYRNLLLELESSLSSCIQVNSKWIKHLNFSPETIKILEERVGNTLQDRESTKDFINRILVT